MVNIRLHDDRRSLRRRTATAGALPRRVRAGYSLGSLVTGAFGTVPGLLLLPYLTDTLGVAAGRRRPAGAAAEGVGRAGQPGRRAGSPTGPGPLGRAPAVPARRRPRAGRAVRGDLRRARSAAVRAPAPTSRSPSWPPPPRSPSSRCRTWRCRPR